MRVLSNWDRGTLYWRIFNSGDTVYVFGYREGQVRIGEYADLTHPKDAFQVQFKRGDIFGRTVIEPGTIYNNSGEYVIIPDDTKGERARLIEISEATSVVLEGGVRFEPYGSPTTQFIDRLGTPSDVTYIVKSSISKSISNSGENGTKVTTGVTDEQGRDIGGKVTAEIPIKAIKLGINFDGNLSEKVITKVEQEVTRQTSYSVTSSESYEEQRTETFVGRKLSVVTFSWSRRFVTGTIFIGTAQTPFEATIGYVISTQTFAFDSFAQMRPELQVEYQRQFPNSTPKIPNVYNPSEQFSAASNPSGVWSYGYSATLKSPFVLHKDNSERGDQGFDWWRTDISGSAVPAIVRNSTTATLTLSTLELRTKELALHPGPNNEFCILRFTAPSSAAYQIKGYFSGRDRQGTTTSVYILAGQNELFNGQVTGFGDGSNVFFNTNVVLNTGDFLDFVVGSGSNNNFSNDTTLLSVQVFAT